MAKKANRKYEFTGETKRYAPVCWRGIKVKRVRALRDIFYKGDKIAKAGDLGGWIQSQRNLSQKGDAWVMEDAVVRGNAQVLDNALVRGSARVSGNACISELGFVAGDAKVVDFAKVYGEARIFEGELYLGGSAQVYGEARVGNLSSGYLLWIGENVRIFERARVHQAAIIHGDAQICGDSVIDGPMTQIGGKAIVRGCAHLLEGGVRVAGSSVIQGHARLRGCLDVIGDTWEVSPLLLSGSQGSLNPCDARHINLLGYTFKTESLLKNFNRHGKTLELTEGQIEEYSLLIRTAAEWQHKIFATDGTGWQE